MTTRYPEIITYPALLYVFPSPENDAISVDALEQESVRREQAQARIRELIDNGYRVTQIMPTAWSNEARGMSGVAVTVVLEATGKAEVGKFPPGFANWRG